MPVSKVVGEVSFEKEQNPFSKMCLSLQLTTGPSESSSAAATILLSFPSLISKEFFFF